MISSSVMTGQSPNTMSDVRSLSIVLLILLGAIDIFCMRYYSILPQVHHSLHAPMVSHGVGPLFGVSSAFAIYFSEPIMIQK